MRNRSPALVALLWLAGLMFVPCLQAQTLVVVDATTIDPATGVSTPHQTVTIQNGTITNIEDFDPAESLPAGFEIVDGAGRFLIPGLWDMHVHLDGHDEHDLTMLLVHGVLNVRDMGGDPFLLAEHAKRIAAGELVAPTIHAAGAILEDRTWLSRRRSGDLALEHRVPVGNPAEARATVAMVASWGADLIKVRNVTDDRTFAATVEAAREHGLTVAGHEPMVVGIAQAARLGMSTFEHLPFLSLTMPGKEATSDEIDATISALLDAGSSLVPTMTASRNLGKPRDQLRVALEQPDPRYDYLSHKARAGWYQSLEDDPGPLPWASMRTQSIEILKKMIAAGVPIAAGTDMGVPLTFPGSALHDEMGLLVSELDLEPLAALQAATSAAAQIFGDGESLIQPGAPADLVLLDRNPLESIDNTRTIRAVIARGELYERKELDALMAVVRESRAAEKSSSPSQDSSTTTSSESLVERLERDCGGQQGSDRVACLTTVAGYRYSKGDFDQALEHYQHAIDLGAAENALQGRFSTVINLLFDGELDCALVDPSFEPMLEAAASSADATLGVLDRILPALASSCSDHRDSYLRRLRNVERSALSKALAPIYVEHYSSYLAKIEGDEEAAYSLRTSELPQDWQNDVLQLQEIAAWCLGQNLQLTKARELAQQAASVAETPIDRLQSMMLEARIASAQGHHRDAVDLMEQIDRLVPNNSTVTSLLQQFRELAAEQ